MAVLKLFTLVPTLRVLSQMIYVFVVIGLKLQINYQIIKSNFFALGAKTGTMTPYEIGIMYI